MHLDLSDSDLDYLHRVLLTRPMGEVEPLVQKIRQQITAQQQQQLQLVKQPASEDAPLESLP